jgi:membrane protease YdiL (CAAX protease family)
MLNSALLPGIVLVILLIRGGRLSDHFGFGKVGFTPTLGVGIGLGVLALALVSIVSVIAQHFIKGEAPQIMIQQFTSAASGKDAEIMLLIGFSAVVCAPIIEEFLFRGIFYPVLARGLGRIPSAVVCSLLFAFAHDTYAAVPSLALLALLFTLVYEATGSLLVPIVMHMTFNGVSLGVQWWVVTHGLP